MSASIVRPGDVVILDPADQRVIVFDWDLLNLTAGTEATTSTFTITAIRQSGVTALTADNASRLTAASATTVLGRTVTGDNRVTQVRLLATTATAGDEYELANKVVTSDAVPQTKEQSIGVYIRQR